MATKTPKKLNILKNDPWLEPYAAAIEGRHQDAVRKERELLAGGAKNLVDFANAHKYFGLHRLSDGSWIFREWAPNATAITLVGDFSGWEERPDFALRRLPGSGVWEGHFDAGAMANGQTRRTYPRLCHTGGAGSQYAYLLGSHPRPRR